MKTITIATLLAALRVAGWGRALLTCGAVLLGAAALAADVVDLDFQRGQAIERRLTVKPGDFVELCGKLLRGQPMAWRFDADRPLDFNIHYHEGDQVTTPTRHDAVRSARGRLRVAVDQDYCWMWTNPGTTTVTLRARLRNEGRRTAP